MKVVHFIGCFVATVCIGYADAQAKADGGYRRGEPRDCDENWIYVDPNGVQTPATTGCLSITDFPPFRDDTELADPQDPRTDTNQWCSFKRNKILSGPNPPDPSTVNANYNAGNLQNVDRLTSWGYCLLEGGTNTSDPTEPPTTSEPETTESPTVSDGDNTESPTVSDGTEQTNSPTVATTQPEAPTTFAPTSESGEPSAASPSNLSSGEIAAAVIVPLVVVAAAAGLFAYYKYHNTNNSGAGSRPQGTPMKTGGKPVSDPEEGRSGQEILHN